MTSSCPECDSPVMVLAGPDGPVTVDPALSLSGEWLVVNVITREAEHRPPGPGLYRGHACGVIRQ